MSLIRLSPSDLTQSTAVRREGGQRGDGPSGNGTSEMHLSRTRVAAAAMGNCQRDQPTFGPLRLRAARAACSPQASPNYAPSGLDDFAMPSKLRFDGCAHALLPETSDFQSIFGGRMY